MDSSGCGRSGRQFPSVFRGVFDDDLPRFSIGVADGELVGLVLFFGHHHDALGDANAAERLLAGFVGVLHVHRRVARIGKQAPLVGMNGFQNAFPRKGIGFKHVKGTGVEHLAAGVLDPQGAQVEPTPDSTA